MHEYRLGEKLLAWYLSSITGFIDAVGFIYLGGFFLSFMSGNTTRMTASMAEGVWDVALKAAGLMGLFLCGVMLGALIQRLGQRHLPHGRPREVVLAFVSTATLVSAAFVAMDNGPKAMLALSFAVGAMNSTFERNGEVSISLTYATGTLVKMAQRFVGSFFGEGHQAWINNALLWLSLATGSVLGGLIYMQIGLRTVWVVAFLVTAGFVVTLAVRQRRRRLGLPL
ncbi:YoaK family protein [Corynebacterium sp. 335C]